MRYEENDVDSKIIGLAGNPNVGKSTIFNTLTGLKQHTGNWPGKTVENASGRFSFQEQDYILYDLPGTYSLIAHSKKKNVLVILFVLNHMMPFLSYAMRFAWKET